MKRIHVLGTAGLTLWLTGCASAPVVLAPIGPNPAGSADAATDGRLEVYSALEGRSEGNNPAWYQPTGYDLCDAHGKPICHVNNTTGNYARSPRPLALPAGKYLVKAQGKADQWLEVPVWIEHGRTTRIHLADGWKPPPQTSPTQLVFAPPHDPVGWCPQPAGDVGMN